MSNFKNITITKITKWLIMFTTTKKSYWKLNRFSCDNLNVEHLTSKNLLVKFLFRSKSTNSPRKSCAEEGGDVKGLILQLNIWKESTIVDIGYNILSID